MFAALRLRGRLTLAFGALVGLLLLMAGAALHQVNSLARLNGLQAELSDGRTLVVQWAGQTRMNVVRAVSLAKAGSPPALADWMNGEMRATSARITELQSQLDGRMAADPEAAALMAKVAQARKAYVDLRAGLLKKLAADPAGAEPEVEGRLVPAAQAYLATLDAVAAAAEVS